MIHHQLYYISDPKVTEINGKKIMPVTAMGAKCRPIFIMQLEEGVSAKPVL